MFGGIVACLEGMGKGVAIQNLFADFVLCSPLSLFVKE